MSQNTESNLVLHAKRELDAVGLVEAHEEYAGAIRKAVIELIQIFADQGHSGGSAPMVASLFYKLANFEPLSAISGNESEWFCHNDSTYQNVRCSSVFKKGANERAYYLDAIVWKTQNGGSFTGSAKLPTGEVIRSRQFVRFPFTPKTFYVDVIEKEVNPDDWEFTIKDPLQLDEVFTYYEK